MSDVLAFIGLVLAVPVAFFLGAFCMKANLTDQRWRDRRSTRRYAQFQGKTISKREYERLF